MTSSKLKVALTLVVLAAPFFAIGQEKGADAKDTSPAQTATEMSSRSAVIIREFTVSEKTSWPYELGRPARTPVCQQDRSTTDRGESVLRISRERDC